VFGALLDQGPERIRIVFRALSVARENRGHQEDVSDLSLGGKARGKKWLRWWLWFGFNYAVILWVLSQVIKRDGVVFWIVEALVM